MADGLDELVALVLNGTAVSASNPLPVTSSGGSSISGPLTVIQPTASSLNATVSQAIASSLNATIVGLGTSGSPSGGVVSIQGVPSGTPTPVSGTFWQGSQTVNQAVASSLNATVTQSTASSLSVFQATASSLNVQAVGNAAAQASDSGNPVKVGGYAVNAEQTLATNGQRQNIAVDLPGRTITFPFSNKENIVSGTATTTGTSDTSLITSAGVGLKNYLTGYSIYNTGTSISTITFKNGSGGSTLWTDVVPSGGRAAFTFPSPVATSTSTALYFAAGTANTTIGVAASGFKGS